MQRTIYAYDLEIKPQRGSKVNVLEPDEYINDFTEIVKKITSEEIKDKVQNFEKDHKILYIDHAKKKQKILEIEFISAKYGTVRTVMNTETLVERGKLKTKPDGDKEKTHILIKFGEDNRAVALYEYNKDGISFPKIVDYLNDFIKKFHTENGDMIFYRLSAAHIVSRDFIKSLKKMKKIKAVTLTVDQEDIGVSDTKYLAGRNDLSSDVDIVLKPASRGASIRGNTVKEFYRMYNNQEMPIKRITVKGDRETKDPLTFDTEKMKEKYPIDVKEDISTGEVDTMDIFCEMEILSGYY